MDWLVRWLRSFGTIGAVENARSLAEERERERAIVDSLTARLALSDREAAAA